MAKPPLSIIERQILRVRRRLLLQIFVMVLLRCLAAALVAVAIWFMLQPIFFAQATAGWKWGVAGGLAGAGLMAALVMAWRQTPSRVTTAMALDGAFGLKERVTTLLTLSAEQAQSPAGQALYADVHERIGSLQVAGKFRLRVSWSRVLAPAGAALLAAAAFFLEPFWSSVGNRADDTPLPSAMEMQHQLDNLKKVSLRQRNEELPPSQELKELENAWDKLVKQPAPKTEEQIRERVTEMRKLEDKLKDRIQNLAGKKQDLKKQLQTLDAGLKKNASKEAKDLEEALAKGQLDKAIDALDRLAKKLEDKKLTKEEQQKLAQELQDLQQKLERLAEHKDQKDKLQRELDEGKISKEQLERELERLAQEAENFKDLQDLADLLGQCKDCLGKDGNRKALKKLRLVKGKLKEMGLCDKEQQALLEDQDRLEEAREAMLLALNECNGQEINRQGLGKKSRLPGGRRPVGKEPDSKIVNARQAANPNPKGQQRITGFTRGGVFSRIPARDVGGAFKQAVQDAPEAIERQRIPPDAADMAKGYFQKLGGQK